MGLLENLYRENEGVWQAVDSAYPGKIIDTLRALKNSNPYQDYLLLLQLYHFSPVVAENLDCNLVKKLCKILIRSDSFPVIYLGLLTIERLLHFRPAMA